MRSATRNKTGKDPAYLEWIRQQPCVVCRLARVAGRAAALLLSLFQRTVEAAHVGQRGISQKCPDREALPLCRHHHRLGMWSHHRLGKYFWSQWNLDREALIREHNEKYNAFCLGLSGIEASRETESVRPGGVL